MTILILYPAVSRVASSLTVHGISLPCNAYVIYCNLQTLNPYKIIIIFSNWCIYSLPFIHILEETFVVSFLPILSLLQS